MSKDTLRKYVIPNLPYVFLFWLCCKLGEAYRVASGKNMLHKLIGSMTTLGKTMASPLPSFHPYDLLVGITGTLLLSAVVYFKKKNAKKFRKDVEYGSARWGKAEDIKPYIDPKPRNNVILTQTESLTMNSRPSSPQYARNKNVMIIGGSGSGKTRFFLKPNLMQLHSSYVITDPKGTVLLECGKLLERNGYRIKVINTIDFSKSMKYNPFDYIKSEKDILKFVTAFISNTKGEGKSGDDFWVKSETLLYTALIGYIYYEAPDDERNMNTLVELINMMEVREDDESFENAVDRAFKILENRDPWHFAVRQYKKYKLAAGKTAKSILISCGARLAPFDIRELRELISYDEMELDTLGDCKTALFVIISDTDTTFSFVAALMYSQLFNLLCDKADNEYGGRLPIHVRFLLDEFANIGKIPNFDKLIATIRSREISACVILQTQSQLKTMYKDAMETIIGNCDTVLFLGGKEKTTLKDLSESLGKETIELYNNSITKGNSPSYGQNFQKLGKELMSIDELSVMDGSKCILQLRGVRPFFSKKYDITKHPKYKYLADFNKKNTFDVARYLNTGLNMKPDDVYEVYEVNETDPETGAFDREETGYVGWQTADEYLSGNVREKLRVAQVATKEHPEFSTNVEALEKVQPKDLEASEISVKLGTTWIDKSYIQQFIHDLLQPSYWLKNIIQVDYSKMTGEWGIAGTRYASSDDVLARITYGTKRINAYEIIRDTLNLKDVRIYDTVEDENGNERRVLNKKETTLATQKQEAIKQAFQEWIFKDPKRRQTLVKLYNERFNSIRPREYDGSHINFTGISPEITLRPHQLNAIAHILYGGNTLLAHEVGAGKTFEMVAAAMESKRLGLCQKSLFAVPNHLTEQWASEFLRLYPSAHILVATKKDFEMKNRKKFCAKIATGEYDAVILGHSQLEKIPISKERQERLLREQIEEITDGINRLKYKQEEKFTIKQLEKTKKSLEVRLTKLTDDTRKDRVVTFEQLGIDRLFVDEAHVFKNLFLYTKMQNVAGLSQTEAQKSSDLFMKCRYMDELTNNKGIILATGTPVSNSVTELYTMQRYLQYDTLKKKDLTHFDCWASCFGETTTAIELAPEGTGYRARTRFAKFHNLPELMCMFKEVADIKTADMLDLPRPKANFHTIVEQPSEIQKGMVATLSERAAAVHNKEIEPEFDNMLKITSDGRKIGLDQRLSATRS